MKLKISDDTLVIFIYILSGIMLTGQFLGINIITSIAFAVSFIVVFSLWCLHMRKAKVLDILSIFIIALSLLGVVITCTSFSVNYFYNWLMFASVFLYFSICIKIKLKKSTIKSLFIINFCVGLICLLAYVLRQDSAFYYTNTGVKYLSFGFYNPNALASFLAVSTFIGMLYFSIYKVKFGTLLKFCYILIFSFLLFQTRSRTSLLVVLCFVVASALFARRKHYYLPKSNIFKIIVAVFPMLFAVIYMLVIDVINKNNFLSFLVSEGKGIDSRQYVWNYAFELFGKSPLFGSYGHLINDAEFSQMHNSHINILVSYGVVVFALVIVFLYIVLKYSIAKSRGTKKALAAWAFIVCLMLGSGESILFSGGLSFYLLVGQFLLICNSGMGNEGELSL